MDGYGSQLVHRFDKNFKLLKTIGGKGKEHGKFNTCHGVWVSTLKKEPEIYIADRANDRVEVYSLDLDYKRTLPDFRMPCCFYQHAGHLYVPELGARVSIIDADDKFVARLGRRQRASRPRTIRQHPDKFATPHALTVDSHGDLYVIEWLDFGRPRKFSTRRRSARARTLPLTCRPAKSASRPASMNALPRATCRATASSAITIAIFNGYLPVCADGVNVLAPYPSPDAKRRADFHVSAALSISRMPSNVPLNPMSDGFRWPSTLTFGMSMEKEPVSFTVMAAEVSAILVMRNDCSLMCSGCHRSGSPRTLSIK